MTAIQDARAILDELNPHVIRLTASHSARDVETVLHKDEISRLQQDGELASMVVESSEAWLAMEGYSLTLTFHARRG